MERDFETVRSMFATMTERGERSTLFWWFVENYDAIASAAKVQRIQWGVVVEQAKELGLTNRAGGLPTRKLAKLTWQRAQAHVARTRRATDPVDTKQSRSVAMPRSVNARPSLAERPLASLSSSDDQDLVPGANFGGQHSNAAPPDIYEGSVDRRLTETSASAPDPPHTQSLSVASPTESPPIETGTQVALARPTAVEPVWTPEQIAHHDAVLASAWAQLDYSDRFIRLKE